MSESVEPSSPVGRTVRIRKDVVRALRLKKGWRVEDLATRAICSRKTIESMEAGKPVLLASLTKVAKALGVENQDLIEAASGPPEAVPPGEPVFQMSCKLSSLFEMFDETSDVFVLLSALERKMGRHGAVLVLNVYKGTVTIDLGFTSMDDAKAVLRLFCELELAELGIFALALHGYDGIAHDLAMWVHRTEPTIWGERPQLEDSIRRLKTEPSADNRVWTKYRGPRGGVYFEIAYDPTNDLWHLQASVDTGAAAALPGLKDLLGPRKAPDPGGEWDNLELELDADEDPEPPQDDRAGDSHVE